MVITSKSYMIPYIFLSNLCSFQGAPLWPYTLSCMDTCYIRKMRVTISQQLEHLQSKIKAFWNPHNQWKMSQMKSNTGFVIFLSPIFSPQMTFSRKNQTTSKVQKYIFGQSRWLLLGILTWRTHTILNRELRSRLLAL